MTENEAIPLHARTILTMHPEADGSEITVDHIYAPEGAFACGDCGGPGHDPGMVGLMVNGDNDQNVGVVLTAEEALVLANRLQRAASLVLESQEDTPDIEREAARFSAPPERPMPHPEDIDPIRRAVWKAWNALADDDPSAVKRIARDLTMSAADVAAIVYPPEQFGVWDDSQEPDLP